MTGPVRVLHVIRRYGLVSEGFVTDTITATTNAGADAWLAVNDLEAAAPEPAGHGRTVQWRRPDHWRVEELAPRRAQRRLCRQVTPVFDRARPDVVHAHFGWSAADVWGACARRGTPLVATFHGSDVTVYPPFRRRERAVPANVRRRHRYHELVDHLDHAIAVSEFLAGGLRDRGYGGPITIIPAGVRLEEFPFRAPRTAPDDPRLLFIGRLVSRKGGDVLLRSFAALPTRHAAATLTIVGEGPERATLRALAAELGVAGRVTFTGAQPRPAVVEHLRGADLLVMASRTLPTGEAEGSPVVTKEALAVGVPFVATDCGGTVETYPPELAHEIVPDGDVEALAHRITALLDDPQSWAERAHLGRRFAEERFSWEALAARHLVLYRTLAGVA